MKRAASVSVILALTVACEFNAFPRPCRAIADCSGTDLCVWDEGDGCDGVGHCEQPGDLALSPCNRSSSRPSACSCNNEPAFPVPATCGYDRPIKALGRCG